MAIDLKLPVMHEHQETVRQEASRFNVLCCGRRWGKNVTGLDLVTETILDKGKFGWYEPTYKSLADVWREAKQLLQPIIVDISETERRIECMGGGVLDMWTLDNPDSSRGRRYNRIFVNEAAMIRLLKQAWEQTIRPTLADFRGDGWFASTPKGRNYFWQLFGRGRDPEMRKRGWRSWQFPTSTNPHIDPEEIEDARLDLPERAYLQEWMAEFLEDVAGVFRGVCEIIDRERTENEPPVSWQRYTGGMDLAKVNDFTVITVLDSTGRQVYFERFNQASWERVIERAVDVFGLYKLSAFWVDCTGVGDPIVEALQRKGIPAQGYHLTNMSKAALIDSLGMGIERKMLKLMNIPAQENELIGFEYEKTDAGNLKMNAPPGEHDDTVIALALANHGLRQMGYHAAVKPEDKKVPEFSAAWLWKKRLAERRGRRSIAA